MGETLDIADEVDALRLQLLLEREMRLELELRLVRDNLAAERRDLVALLRAKYKLGDYDVISTDPGTFGRIVRAPAP